MRYRIADVVCQPPFREALVPLTQDPTNEILDQCFLMLTFGVHLVNILNPFARGNLSELSIFEKWCSVEYRDTKWRR